MQDMAKEPRILEIDVYGGPGSKAYAKIGYIGVAEKYTKLWDEYGYKSIEYTAQNDTKKRGYISGGSSAATYPGEFATGCRGTANGSSTVTVYWYPEANDNCYFGRLSGGETFTYLKYDPTKDMQFIEYSTGGGTKRGYIRTSDGTPQSNTILAKAKGDISTFTTPGGGNDGYLYEEEYCIILAQSKYYYSIEYNTVTGRKVAFVLKSNLTAIGSLSKVPSVQDPGSNAIMRANQAVYGGPSSRIYASIGSVDANEEVSILHQDENYCYIQYYTSTSYKRGYVPTVSIADYPSNVPDKTGTYTHGYYMRSLTATNVYSAPDSTSAALGSVYANEGVTYLGVTEGIFAFVEYSSMAGTKRGFIHLAHLFKTYEKNGFGRCSADTNVYYAPGSAKIGEIYANEYVCILNRDIEKNIYYIEYNSANGRKRGYAASHTIVWHSGELDTIDSSYTGHAMKSSNCEQSVYSGPSTAYYSVGNIYQNEGVSYFGNDGDYAYIQYTVSGSYKRGYVPVSTLQEFGASSIVTDDDLRMANNIPGATCKYFGTSGEKREISYYIVGNENAPKQMILNFAIHGHEDPAGRLEQDGYELTKLAVKLTKKLGESVDINGNLGEWCVYIIPALNPDGIIYKHGATDPHDAANNCNGKGRHNTVDLNWNQTVDWNNIMNRIGEIDWDNIHQALSYFSLEYTQSNEGIDMNRCYPFKNSEGIWTYNKEDKFINKGRNYIGNSALRAKEALYLWALINKIYNKQPKDKVFIDTHGWTNQIISGDKDIEDAFRSVFEHHGSGILTNGTGYVALYAHNLGFRSCLFEFPGMDTLLSSYNFNFIETKGWDELYINAIEIILGLK